MTTTQQSAHRPAVDRFVDRHPFATFVLLAYGISWSLWAAAYAGAGDVPFFAGVLGPMVAAIFVLRRTGASLGDWTASLVRWRVGARWWVYALGLPIGLYAVVSLVLQLLGHPVDWGLAIDRAPAYAATWLFVLVLGGALEEPGWRGFGLPHLLGTRSPLRATLIIGLVWGVWHVPLYGPLGFVVPLVLAFFYTYLWARTRSALLCVVLHASFTPAQDNLVLMARERAYSHALDAPDIVIITVYVAAAALLLLVTKGRLGVPDTRGR
ncbi:type II CAAX endopeptidase family protein [Nocardioides sp.]|uniref:CPBP family intramembrane glutamic endopeptidase n=1 Tax=Nocardioides sp. TaxID=35761 RepID=UPI002ED69CCA